MASELTNQELDELTDEFWDMLVVSRTDDENNSKPVIKELLRSFSKKMRKA